ncbi:MAG: hypothetical protein KC561_20565, partial [Myxococcales bacterium]|nr:hypothetical protein [Myxococcales bacterium]
MSKADAGKRKLPVWATALILLVAFAATAVLATLVMQPLWLVQRRLRSGDIGEFDRERMRQSPPYYVNVTTDLIIESLERNNDELALNQAQFLVDTMESVDLPDKEYYETQLVWALAGIIELIDDEARAATFVSSVSNISPYATGLACQTTEELIQRRHATDAITQALLDSMADAEPERVEIIRGSCRHPLVLVGRRALSRDELSSSMMNRL